MKTCKQPYESDSYKNFCSYDCREDYSTKQHAIFIQRNEHLSKIIRPLPRMENRYDIPFGEVKQHIQEKGIVLNPDFQRGNVWTQPQQIAFIESILKGRVHEALRTVIVNRVYEDENPEFHGELIIDGLQRLTAIMAFIDGEFKVFDNQLGVDDLKMSSFNIRSQYVKFQVMNLQTKKDVLQFYIDFNTGGTVHSDSEIERVKQLLEHV